jgi:hypothetical protein
MKVKDSKFIIIKIGEQNLSLAFEALFKLILILIKKILIFNRKKIIFKEILLEYNNYFIY